MTKLKIGGAIITGMGAWMLINKGLNIISQISRDCKEAQQWKAYYKYGTADSTPPGYSTKTKTKYADGIEIEETVDNGKSKIDFKAPSSPVESAVKKTIDTLFDKEEAPEEALEGQEKASESVDNSQDEKTDE